MAIKTEGSGFVRAWALAALGRCEEAVILYPRRAAYAYMKLGRYADAIDVFPTDNGARVQALYSLGRRRELLNFPENDRWTWGLAQLLVRPEAILEQDRTSPEVLLASARLVLALRGLMYDDVDEAEKLLSNTHGLRSADLWWDIHNPAELLVGALTRGMMGDRDGLQADLECVLKNHRLKFKQVLWHDAAFLTRAISADDYQKQPCRLNLRHRLTFVQAVAHDLAGKQRPAAAGYRSYISETHPFFDGEITAQRFAEWRLHVLK